MSNADKQVILLLAGWSGAGKDTVADFLVANHGFQKTAFANPLKDEVAKNLSIDRALCDTQEGKRTLVEGKPVRQHLIDYGEKVRRIQGMGYWASTLCENSPVFDGPKVVISDWRNLFELFEVQKRCPEATIVPILVSRSSQLVSPVPDATEYALMGFPFKVTLKNDACLNCLYSKVKKILDLFGSSTPMSLSTTLTPSTTGNRSDSSFSGFYIF
jgi:hypothetical protein